tara:strand:+ start:204 stop:626 length:423 start_codon:yes stop_codon:yes gene_type:complete
VLTFLGAGMLTVILRLDTPWAPWESGNTVFFPPMTFTIASFFAAFFAVSGGTILLNIMSYISKNPSKLWRLSSVAFLILYGGYSFTSGTLEAGIMLNILHLIVAIPSLVLIPRVVILQVQIETVNRTNSDNTPELAVIAN